MYAMLKNYFRILKFLIFDNKLKNTVSTRTKKYCAACSTGSSTDLRWQK